MKTDWGQKWYIIAMLGVMKAGGAFSPLDPTHPTSRLEGLVKSLPASVLLCSEKHVEKLRPVVKTLIPLCDETLDSLPGPVELASGVTSQNAAYVLFTSGSTGEPKVSSCFTIVLLFFFLFADLSKKGHPVGTPGVPVQFNGTWAQASYLPRDPSSKFCCIYIRCQSGGDFDAVDPWRMCVHSERGGSAQQYCHHDQRDARHASILYPVLHRIC
jgi:hypothetical protein